MTFGEEEANQQQIYARNLLRVVSLNLKLTTLHQLTNKAFDNPIREFLEVINPAMASGEAQALQVVGPNYFVNHEAIQLDYNSFESGQRLRDMFERVEIGEIAFSGACVTEESWREFLAIFQEDYLSREPAHFNQRKFTDISVREIGAMKEGGLDQIQIDERQNVLRHYATLTLVLDKAMENVNAGRAIRLAQVRRAVQGLAEVSPGHESLIVGLTRFPNLSGKPHFHLASTSALAVLMARKLGLGRDLMSDLGISAALHGLSHAEHELSGEAMVEEELQAALAAAQESAGAIEVICAGSLSVETLGFAATAFECNLPVTVGLPSGDTSLLSRMVSVACAFDRMTAVTPPHRPVLPDRAMRIILDGAGTAFDERITRLFTATVGLYPVGTTVQLSGGEMAVVMEVPGDPAHYGAPRVKVFRDRYGQVDYLVDLADQDGSLRIVESVDPLDVDVNAAQFLLA